MGVPADVHNKRLDYKLLTMRVIIIWPLPHESKLYGDKRSSTAPRAVYELFTILTYGV